VVDVGDKEGRDSGREGQRGRERRRERVLKMEIEKFNGKIFELWKLKMEDLLVDRD
jgi:hypothetical protein